MNKIPEGRNEKDESEPCNYFTQAWKKIDYSGHQHVKWHNSDDLEAVIYQAQSDLIGKDYNTLTSVYLRGGATKQSEIREIGAVQLSCQ